MNDNTADRDNPAWMEQPLSVLGPFELPVEHLELLKYCYEGFMELVALSYGCGAGDVIDVQMSVTMNKTQGRQA